MGIRWLAAFAAVSLFACADAEPPVEELENPAQIRAIDAVRETFAKSHSQGDAEGLAGLYAQDAILLPPDRPAISGRQSIQDYFQTIFRRFGTNLHMESEELHVVGDWALDRGVYQLHLVPQVGDGEPIREQGNYVVILQLRTDASWDLARHIWNRDAGPASGER